MSRASYWESVSLPVFHAVSHDVSVDVAIVGAGMTGVMTAYMLKRAGRRVALIERDRCARLDTARTTAHLTHVTDKRLHQLVQSLGRDHAQAVWDAGNAAIQQIHAIARAEGIACDFAWTPGYLCADINGEHDESADLRAEVDLANELGFSAEFVGNAPIFRRPAVRYSSQAIFHPLKFIAGLLHHIPREESFVFENSPVTAIERIGGGPLRPAHSVRLTVGKHTISARHVVIATDVPLAGLSNVASAAALQTKITGYSSYAIGARCPNGLFAQACLWDTADPYHFLRIHHRDSDDYVVFGGLDHKTGQEADAESRFEALRAILHRLIPQAVPDHSWSGQVIESHDGLPLIGETAPGQFIATGYSGNGLTFGVVAAMMICDAICGRPNPWKELFTPNRTTWKSGAWNYLRENADYPYYMLKDRLTRGEDAKPESIPLNTGRILKVEGRRAAVYRDSAGRVTVLSAVCPHLGCIVRWNDAESTWDCPCHGSRFRATGEILAGPAETSLPPLNSNSQKPVEPPPTAKTSSSPPSSQSASPEMAPHP